MSKRRNFIIAILVTALCALVAFGCAPKKQPDITYTVTFIANGGAFSDGSTQTEVTGVKADTTVTAPAVSRESFDFTGWHTDLAATNLVDLSTYIIKSDMSFYAGWKAKDDTPPTPPPVDDPTLDRITASLAKTEYIQGQTVDLSALVVKAYYSDDSDKTLTSSDYTFSPTSVDTSTTGAKTVTVSYEGKTTTVTITVIAKVVTALSLNADGLVKSNYNLGETFNPNGLEFTATYNDGSHATIELSDPNLKFESTAMAVNGTFATAGDHVLVVAKYGSVRADADIYVNVIQKFTVTFNKNVSALGVSDSAVTDMPETITGIDNGSAVASPARTPELKGYTFDGWYKQPACIVAWNFTNDTVNSATILYAKWTAKTDIAIAYNKDGGTIVVGGTENPTTYAPTNNRFDPLTLTTLQKTHYDFKGWYLNEEKTGTPVTQITYADIPTDGTTITLYASFELTKYSITFDLTGTSEYTVSFKTPGAWANKKYTYGSTVALPTESDVTVTKLASNDTTYSFAGWNLPGGSTATINGSTLSGGEGNITLTVRISSVAMFNFTFNLKFGTNNTSTSRVEQGSTVSSYTPTRTGYTFGGWYDDENCGGTQHNFSTQITQDTTVYAKWTLTTYTVSYNLGGKATAQPNATSHTIVATDVTLQYPTSITTGWRFTGWYNAESEGSRVYKLDAALIEANGASTTITLYARYDNHWTLSFDDNVPSETISVPASRSVEYNATVDSVNAPERSGYSFGGWFTDTASTVPWTFGASGTAMPAHNVTLYAKWIENAASGWYLMPSGYETKLTDGSDVSSYVLTNGTKSGLQLSSNSEFVILNFNHDDGTKEYRNTSNTVTPSAAMAITRTGNVYKVTTYTAGASARWTATSTNSTLTLTLAGYYKTYNKSGAEATLATANAVNGTAYVFGNFTNGAYTTEWANATTVGGKFYFQNVALRQFDKFDIRYNGNTIAGESITVTGNYNIVFDPSGSGTVTVYEVPGGTLSATVNTANVFVDGSISKADLTVMLGGSSLNATDYDIIPSTPVSGADASKVIIIYHGTILEKLYTATEVVENGVEIAFKNDAKSYHVGDTPDSNDFTVTVTYNNGGRQEITTGFDLSLIGEGDESDLFAAKQGQVKVVYGTFEATCNADIYNKVTLMSVSATGSTSFVEGTAFSLTGITLTVTVYFNRGADKSVTLSSDKYTLDPAVGTTLGTVGSQAITVTYADDTTIHDSFNVTVNAKQVTSLTVSGAPTKTSYNVGERFVPAGLTVMAIYDNGDEENVTARDGISFVNATYYSSSNNYFIKSGTGIKLTASFGGKTAEIPTELTVNDVLTGIAVTVEPTEPRAAGWVAGDTFALTGMVVTATYNGNVTGGNTERAVNGYTLKIGSAALAAGDTLAAGTHTVTVSYTEGTITKTAEFTLEVDTLKVESIVVTGTVAKQYAGRPFNPNGLTFTAVYNNGVSQTITDTENITYSGSSYDIEQDGGFNTTGTGITLTATYSGKSYDISGIEVVYAPLRDITYIYVNDSYTVTGYPANCSVEKDSVLTEPSAPSCIGFTFDGWFTDEARTSAYDFSAPVTSNLTLYAKWTIKEYTINFNAGTDGTLADELKSVTVTIENIASATLPTPTNVTTGKRFVAWKNGSATVTAPLTLGLFSGEDRTVTLTAEYVVIEYVYVSFDLNYTGAVNNIERAEIEKGDTFKSADFPTAPTRTGYSFDGWYYEATDPQTILQEGDTISADVTVYAKWTEVKYIVTFDGNKPTGVTNDVTGVPASINTADNATISEPIAPTLIAHDFGGWYKEKNCTTAWNFATDTVTGDTTLYAKWTAVNGVYNATTNVLLKEFVVDDGKEGKEYAAKILVLNSTTSVTFYDGGKIATNNMKSKQNDYNYIKNVTISNGKFSLEAGVYTIYYTYGGNDLGVHVKRYGDTSLYEKPELDTEVDGVYVDGVMKAPFVINGNDLNAFMAMGVTFGTGTSDTKTYTITFKYTHDYPTGNATILDKTNDSGSGGGITSVFKDNTITLYAGTYDFHYVYHENDQYKTGRTWIAGTQHGSAPTGSYLVIGSEKHAMIDNSEQSDYHAVEHMLENVEIESGATLKFTVNTKDVKVYIDSNSTGVEAKTGLQSTITTTATGAFTFYLYKTSASDTNWTIYVSCVEHKAWYAVGKFTGNAVEWGYNAAYAVNNGTIELNLKKGDLLKFVGVKTENGQTTLDWESGSLGTNEITVGSKYSASDSSGNIQIRVDGNYTFTITNDGKIEITADVDEPDDIDLSGYHTITLAFSDKTITVAFAKLNWGNNDMKIYVVGNSGTKYTGEWPGIAMDGTTKNINAKLSDVKLIVSFTEYSDIKQTIDLEGSKFTGGTIFAMSENTWKDGKINPTIKVLA